MTDLAILIGLVVITVSVLVLIDAPPFVDRALGIPFLLLYPGYAFVSALLPESPAQIPDRRSDSSRGWISRLALSVGLSAIIAAVTGLAVIAVDGLEFTTVIVSIGIVTVLGAMIASFRRRRVPSDRRVHPLTTSLYSKTSGSTGYSRLHTVTGLLGALVLVGAIAYVAMVPPPSESFSELYVLNEQNGSLVAEGYPTTFVAGEPQSLFIALENHEGHPVTYEIVVTEAVVGNDGTSVSTAELARTSERLAAGERVVLERPIAPTLPGDRVRLDFMAYEGSAPPEVDPARADLSVHLWVEVVA